MAAMQYGADRYICILSGYVQLHVHMQVCVHTGMDVCAFIKVCTCAYRHCMHMCKSMFLNKNSLGQLKNAQPSKVESIVMWHLRWL